ELLQRQQKHVKKTNGRLFENESRACKVEVAASDAREQSLVTYDRYKTFKKRADKDLVVEERVDALTQETHHIVRSWRHTDAPPRVFPHFSSRCDCEERLAEQDMCPHEIKAKNGFHDCFFLERHMARECVSGSLTGWVEGQSPHGNLDRIIGYESENIHESLVLGGVADGATDGDEGMADEHGVGANMETAVTSVVPPGYMSEKGGKAKPLDRKTVSNILQCVCAGYGTYSVDKQFAVSDFLALQLQESQLAETQLNPWR
ncbi:hypothetical protein ACHAXR_000749, partial [Thalassiosira sp. AJA248-18]